MSYVCTNCSELQDDEKSYGPWCKNCLRLGKYNLTVDEFETLMKEQDGRCVICHRILDPPCVDHDHKTNKVRGLLCNTCNSGLGLFRDSIRNLASTIVYLEDNGKSFES